MMIKLQLLIYLQYAFAVLSVSYLFASLWRLHATGEALSAAAIWPSILMFVAYSACLTLPYFGKIGWYRFSMVFALILFGAGGVIGNISRYLNSGLEHYASVPAWAIAVGINLFGTILNIIALLGLFRRRDGNDVHPHTRRQL